MGMRKKARTKAKLDRKKQILRISLNRLKKARKLAKSGAPTPVPANDENDTRTQKVAA